MAKPDYPGLVLVPPSDRSILKRRLAKWAFLIILIIGGLSSLNIWLPSPDRTRDCRNGADAASSYPLRPDCTQTAQAIVDASSPQLGANLNPGATKDASEHVIPAKSRAAKPVSATPSPKRPTERPLTPHKTAQTTNTSPANLGNSTPNRMVAALQAHESSASLVDLQQEASQPSAQHKTAQVSNASPANPWNDAYSRMVGSLPTNESTTSLIAIKHGTSQPSAQHKTAQVSNTSPANPWNDAYSRMVAASQANDSPASLSTPPQGTGPLLTQANPDALLAEQGDAFAQYRLGRFYAQQSGLHSPESVSWYRKASDGLRRLASNGNGKAMYVLGVMYAFGRGVVQDKEEARSWLAQALAHQVPAAGPVLASLDKNRPADPNSGMAVQTKRRQT